jgi:hypothetical protein
MRSTGPRTVAGKTQSSMNAFKHGLRSATFAAEESEALSTIQMVRSLLDPDRSPDARR